jgi:hypothetical protein
MLDAVRDGGQEWPATPDQRDQVLYSDAQRHRPVVVVRYEARQNARPLLLVNQPLTAWRIGQDYRLTSVEQVRYAAIVLPEEGEASPLDVRTVAWGRDVLGPQTVTVGRRFHEVALLADPAYRLPAAASDQGQAIFNALYGMRPSEVETIDDGRIAGLLNLAFAAHPEAMVMNGQANAAPRCVALAVDRFKVLGLDREVNTVLGLSQAAIDRAAAAAAAGRPAEFDRCVCDALRSRFSSTARDQAVSLEYGSLRMHSEPDSHDRSGMSMLFIFSYTAADGQEHTLPPYSIRVDQL